jgi:hypothetical protein
MELHFLLPQRLAARPVEVVPAAGVVDVAALALVEGHSRLAKLQQ